VRIARSREDEAVDRDVGGRVGYLPIPQIEIDARTGERRSMIAAEIRTSGARNERVTVYIPDCVYLSLNVESGRATAQLKAKALWSMGTGPAMSRYLGLVSWWLTGRMPELSELAGLGWRTTGVELCADFVGLAFDRSDVENIIGFRKGTKIADIAKSERLQTIQVGSRASRVSMCIYDKDQQLADVKGGDDSTYRATHLEHGWDGQAERRRVEARLSDGGLTMESEKGDRIDLRDPAALADQELLAKTWAIITAKHRLIVPGSTRRERCKTDPRWLLVQSAAGVELKDRYRQTRESQVNTWEESMKRSRRELVAAKDRQRALLNVPEDVSDDEFLAALASDLQPLELEGSRERRRRYGDTRSEHIGEEIRTLGRERWRRMRAQLE
jgi:hypothetical protein